MKIKCMMATLYIYTMAVCLLGQTACQDERDDSTAGDDNDNNDQNDNDDNDDNNDDGDNDDNDGNDNNNDSGSDSDVDTDSDSDTDTDSDSDGDTDGCSPPAWGTGFNQGQAVANWNLNVIYDQNQNNAIDDDEMTSSTLNLEEIMCDGYNSAFVMLSSETWPNCPSWFSSLVSGGVPDAAIQYKSALIMFNVNGAPTSAQQCYNEFSSFGFTFGFYNGNSLPFTANFTPFHGFINLNTGIVVRKDTMFNPIQSAQEVKTLMQQAAQ